MQGWTENDKTRKAAGHHQSMEHNGTGEDLHTGSLVEIDGLLDWCPCLLVDTPSDLPAAVERPSCSGFGPFNAAQLDDDEVLDQWLVSLTPDEFGSIIDGLAELEGGDHSALESTGYQRHLEPQTSGRCGASLAHLSESLRPSSWSPGCC
jgi:hypothetical protein